MNKIATHNSATGERSKNLLHALFTPFAKCQDKTIHEQYHHGVRWFDLRVDKDLVPCHGLWKSNKTLIDILTEIGRFEEEVYITVTIERKYSTKVNIGLCERICEAVNLRSRGKAKLVYIAEKKPKWNILHAYRSVPVVSAYLSVPTPKQYLTLPFKDWRRYIPIPRVLKKITPKAEFNDDCFTMVDFV
jgi:hypothetical protein